MMDAPERIWVDFTDTPSGAMIGTAFSSDIGDVEYIRADLHEAAIRAARIEGYEIARREAVARGFHLVPEVVEGMQRKDVIRAQSANAGTVRFANYIVQVLRILFEQAIDLGWRADNPARGVSLLKSGRPPREAWPRPLVQAFREAAEGRTLLIFELCVGTGQRIADVLKMRWGDIEDGCILVTQGKTKARLAVPITPRLAAVLEATPRIGLTICAWGVAGKPTHYRTAADLIMSVRRQIGAEAFDIHSLRYTTAAELAEAGCSDELIMAVTGHKTSAMVALYSGPARQKARAREAQERRRD